LQAEPDFYSDQARVSEIEKKYKQAEGKIELVKNLENKFGDIDTLIEFCEMGEDEMYEDLKTRIADLTAKMEEIKIQTLLKGKYDNNNAIVNIHAGAGGTEAQDWTDMLTRMYTMYANKEGFDFKVLDILPGDDAGIKNITFLISGENAYGFLKAEKGVHRLVRISPFDANSRRHTSFASVEVMPEIDEAPEIQIRPEDLKVDTYRSSGAGGQHVNKTESAIRITHVPTGIVVSCQTERSQIQNRETAMKMLYSKLVEKQEAEEMEKLANIKGEIKKIEWGSQIRSYVFCPYTLVKDHRTGYETSNVQAVMDGDIQPFINDYLRKSS
jgi:peptide chain release factor 2